jgi:hypothetical protein
LPVSVGLARLPEGIADLLGEFPQQRASDVHVPVDVRDAENQENGRGGVASVMKTAVPYARVPQQPLPDVIDPFLLLLLLVLPQSLAQWVGQADRTHRRGTWWTCARGGPAASGGSSRFRPSDLGTVAYWLP